MMYAKYEDTICCVTGEERKDDHMNKWLVKPNSCYVSDYDIAQ